MAVLSLAEELRGEVTTADATAEFIGDCDRAAEEAGRAVEEEAEEGVFWCETSGFLLAPRDEEASFPPSRVLEEGGLNDLLFPLSLSSNPSSLM